MSTASTPASTPAPSTSAAPSVPTTPPTSVAPTVTGTPPPTVQTTVTAAPVRSTCTKLMLRVIVGSAAAGREFAALQFTNTGAKTCTLNGYPTVTLLVGGKRIGTASVPASGAKSSRTLAPGDTAESALNDYTSCQAPLSDTIHVVAPGSTISTSRPGQLRACTMQVGRLGAPE